MMAVAVSTAPSFTAAAPRLLFEGPYGFSYDVAPGGQRFVMIKGPESAQRQVNVVLGWLEELRRRVAPGGI